jgi:hypothetical protein
MATKWGAADDAKLAELFRTKKLNPKKIDKASVLEAAKKYWPNRTGNKFDSFLATYKRKCNKWNLEETLKHARGGERCEYSCFVFCLAVPHLLLLIDISSQRVQVGKRQNLLLLLRKRRLLPV